MQSAVDYLQELFRGIGATQKPDAGLLRHLKIPIETDHLPIEDVCLVSVVNGLLKLQPYDRSWVPAVYQVINASKLGIFPEKTKDCILVKFPQMTGERRQELVAVVKELAEKQRIAVRNIRRDARKSLPQSQKQIEELSAKTTQEIDDLLANKVKNLQGNQFKFN